MDIYENNEMNEPEVQPEESQYRIRFDAPVEPEATQPKAAKRKSGILTAVLLTVTILSMAVCAFFCVRLTAQEKRTEQLLSQLRQQITALQEELNSKSFTGNGNSVSGTDNEGVDGGMTPGQVYAQTIHSVVAITNEIVINNNGQVATATSAGSGFIWSEDGYIVTNYHVVENATKLTVTTHDGVEHPATLCGFDATHDLAVLKIEAKFLQPVAIGSSSDLIVGDQVAVIGNPLGDLTSTLTVGYISAKDRVITTDGSRINMLQTDASVNSGNSGGPIFNMKGEVVGIITAKYSGITNSGASIEGIGFAIPIDDVVRKITDLKDHGYITGAYLGILVQDVDASVAEYYGLPLGAYVKSTTPGFCAEKAGLRARDIIVGLGDHVISNMNDLSRALQDFQGGDTTVITVWRAGVLLELEITLDERPHP